MTDRIVPTAAESAEAPPNPLRAQFIDIMQKGEQAPKSTDRPKEEVGDALFNAVLAAKPTDFGQGVRDAQTAAKAFTEEPDKAKALAKGAPVFEAAIKQSDADYISAIAKYSPEFNQKKLALESSQLAVVMDMRALQGSFSRVPEDKQGAVARMIALASDSDTSAGLTAALRVEMGKYPGLLENVDKLKTAMDAEESAEKAMDKAAQPLMHAAYEEAATRYIYAHALELCGKTSEAFTLKEEGKGKVDQAYFEFLDKPVPPKNVQEA